MTNRLTAVSIIFLVLFSVSRTATAQPRTWRVATFEADITIPIGHACMGGGIADARKIVDPLFAKGFVLLEQNDDGREMDPVVIVALDWCQCNNDSYDRWRDILAEAAGTSRERVMLATVHQHDAPICDLTAQKLLDQHGMKGANCDPEFHEQAVQKTAAVLKKSLPAARTVTHIGQSQTKVKEIASNRRIIDPKGRISWNRGSSSGNIHDAPEGEIDPWLKTLSFWDGDQPVLAWSSYAVHPMSYYGRGQVSADFPGMARERLQKENPDVFQIYFTGCAGDTTAGKYNTGKPQNRKDLADRLYDAMATAWKETVRRPIGSIDFRSAELRLAARDEGDFSIERMNGILANPKESKWARIRAALGLSWRKRVDAGQPIDVPCLDFGSGQTQFMIMPAETFVGYQLVAQRLRPESFVMVSGFGDGAPGYIPTDQCWSDGYADDYCWVARNTQQRMTEAMEKAMKVQVDTTANANSKINEAEITKTAAKLTQHHRDKNWPEVESLLMTLFSGDREFAASVISIPIKDPTIQNRTHLIHDAERAGLKEIVPTLISLLDDSDKSVRSISVSALGTLGDNNAIGPLEQLLKRETDPRRQLGIREVLAGLGRPYLQYFIAGLSDRDPSRRRRCIHALGSLHDPRAMPHLLRILIDTPDRWEFADGEHITDWNAIDAARSIKNITGIENVEVIKNQPLTEGTIGTKTRRRPKKEIIADCQAWLKEHEKEVGVKIEEPCESWEFTREPLLPGLKVAFNMNAKQVREVLDQAKVKYRHTPAKRWKNGESWVHQLEMISGTTSAFPALNQSLTRITYRFHNHRLDAIRVQIVGGPDSALKPLIEPLELREKRFGQWSGLSESIVVSADTMDAEKVDYEIGLNLWLNRFSN